MRRIRARKLERFFGVPATSFQQQQATSPKHGMSFGFGKGDTSGDCAVPTPVPRSMKQTSLPSIAPSTKSDFHPRNDSTANLIQHNRSSSGGSQSRPNSQQQSPPPLPPPQHVPNSHSISTSSPSMESTQQKVTSHGYSQSQSHVNIGVERTKRWPPLTSMVKDIDRDRTRAQLQFVDENNAEQMKDVMARLRKLK